MADKDRQQTLKANYQKLRKAGFSSAEATRYRGASTENIERAIRSKQLPRVNPVARAARTGEKVTTAEKREYKLYIDQWKKESKQIVLGVAPRTIQKGPIRYQSAEHPLIQNYLSNYTYLVAYQVRNSDGTLEWKYITITSNEKRFKKDLWQEMDEILEDSGSRYDSTVLRHTYGLVAAYQK